MRIIYTAIVCLFICFLQSTKLAAAVPCGAPDSSLLHTARINSSLSAEAFKRCQRYVEGWLAHADPKTGLIPRNLTRDVDLWNGRDSAADNYPYMVLTTSITDHTLFSGRMRDILKTEIKLTRRVDRLGDHYSFAKSGFMHDNIDMERIVFDNSEYVKDGLVPITEWLGESAWSDRAIALLEDIWRNASIATPFGKIATTNFEVNGDLLQACSRFYWFTGDVKFLNWAIRLGDYYLLGDNHPTRNREELRLKDHGCEMINGLSELYAAVARARPDKKAAYQKPLYEIFDSILQYGRNQDGLLYTVYNPHTGAHAETLGDNWGYVYDGFYTLYLVDGRDDYRDAVQQTLNSLDERYYGAFWDEKNADGFADSIEGAINLLNRLPTPQGELWVDRQIPLMWKIQRDDGVIEGWHGDGNFARTSLMYALWKTQGLRPFPWRSDVKMGAVLKEGNLYVLIASEKPWHGRILFDQARHKTQMHMPMDYPRINQFPEWCTVARQEKYHVSFTNGNYEKVFRGEQLLKGIPIKLKGGTEEWLCCSKIVNIK